MQRSFKSPAVSSILCSKQLIVLSFANKNGLDDEKVDIWSIGITILEMCDLKLPHGNLNPMRAMFAITKSESPSLTNRDRSRKKFSFRITTSTFSSSSSSPSPNSPQSAERASGPKK